jgi:broad specificity phosphatase PhoE
LILVRHGQQEWPEGPNPAASEWVDPPLSAIGQRQAELVGASLAHDNIDAVYSSHLKRAAETGGQIAKHHGIDPVVYQELREIEIFRDLPPGASIRDVVRPPFLRGMQERFVRERRWDVYPYTETSAEFRHRVLTSVEGIPAMVESSTPTLAMCLVWLRTCSFDPGTPPSAGCSSATGAGWFIP